MQKIVGLFERMRGSDCSKYRTMNAGIHIQDVGTTEEMNSIGKKVCKKGRKKKQYNENTTR